MFDVNILSGISGLSFDFPIPIYSLVFRPCPVALSVLSFVSVMVHPPPPPRKKKSSRDRLFCMTLVE